MFLLYYLHAMKWILVWFMAICVTSLCAQDTVKPYWYGRSGGKLPEIAYGLGEDRLGGAKMGYIDTGVVLKIIDSVKERYQIQLSKYHTAYIAKADVTRDSAFVPKPFYLTNRWRAIGGDAKYDSLFITMDERLPYKSWMEINPSRIVIELYGVQSNTNWITQVTSSLQEIGNIYFVQAEDDVVRVTIELKHHQHWGYTIHYINGRLVVMVKRQPEVLAIQNLRIAIDAGHGGTNTGAAGVKSKIAEKKITIEFARELEKYLCSKGVEDVIMTRMTDTTIGNTDRVLWLQQAQPDILISLHLNSSDEDTVKGSSTYYKHIGFRPLGMSILQQMFTAGMADYGNVGNFNFLLNQPTDFPNTLLEIGFLSNVDDEKNILNPQFQHTTAVKIYEGILDFLRQCQ